MKRLVLVILLALVALPFCHGEKANATAFNACSSWGTPDQNAAFGVMVCMGTGSGPPTACPQGTSFPDDGCAAAPAPLTALFSQPNAFQPAGYINTISNTPSNYMATDCGPASNQLCRPPFNVAGVDYAIGSYGTLNDPADPAFTPAGCSYSATGSSPAGGPLLQCGVGNGTGTFTGMSNIELGPIGGHDCTAVEVDHAYVSGVSAVTFDDVHYFNNTSNCATSGIAIVYKFTNDWARVTFNSVYFDGNADPKVTTKRTVYGACAIGTLCAPQVFVTGGCPPVYINYSYIANFVGNELNCPEMHVQFSVIGPCNAAGPNGHSECYDGLAGSYPVPTQFTMDHVLYMQGKNYNQDGPAPIWNTSAWGSANTLESLTKVTQINAWIGFNNTRLLTGHMCEGNSVSSGGTPGSVPPTCVTGGAGSTSYIYVNDPGTPGNGLPDTGNITPFTCGGGFLAGNLGPPATITGPEAAMGITGKWVLDGDSANQYGDLGQYVVTAHSCTGNFAPQTATDSNITNGHGFNPLTNGVATGNFWDTSSGLNPLSTIDTGASTVVGTIVSATVTSTGGSTSTLTWPTTPASIALVAGEVMFNTGVTGCTSSTLQNCPAVVTSGTYAAGSTVQLTGLAGTSPFVGNLDATAGSICTNPWVISGNISISDTYNGIANTNALNTLQHFGSWGGC